MEKDLNNTLITEGQCDFRDLDLPSPSPKVIIQEKDEPRFSLKAISRIKAEGVREYGRHESMLHHHGFVACPFTYADDLVKNAK